MQDMVRTKINFNRLVLVAFVVLFPAIVLSQYCNNFHRDYCYPSDNKRFKINGQSKSASFAKGQISDLNLLVYKGQDYRVSLCMDENLGSEIKFRIIETVKVRVKKVVETKSMVDEFVTCKTCNGTGEVVTEVCYECNGETTVATGGQVEVVNKATKSVIEKQKRIIFDNSKAGFSSEIEFSASSTRKLTLEVSIPGESSGSQDVDPQDLGCVGVLVEFMSSPLKGF